jgi:hypothetical protein
VKRTLFGTGLALVLTVLACTGSASAAGTFSCRASAARASVSLLGITTTLEPFVANKPSSPCLSDSASLTNPNPVKVGGATLSLPAAKTVSKPTNPRASASSSVANLVLVAGTAVIKANVLSSHAEASCGPGGAFLTGGSQVVGASLNGLPITIPPGDATVTIPLLTGKLVLNEKDTSHAGKLIRRALHLVTPLGLADVVIAESEADYAGTPCVGAPPPPQCSDGADNDGDGKIDTLDPGCHTDGNAGNPGSYDPGDNNEADPPKPQCSDGIDNDGDGKVDALDPGCHTDGNAGNSGSYDPADNDETNQPSGAPQCSDGIDNDGDGGIDSFDPACHTDGDVGNSATYTPDKDTEVNPITQCDDGIDNDGDGKIDYPNDPGCSNAFVDNDESNPITQCSDGVDNDGDAKIDSLDPQCHTDGDVGNSASYDASDNDESH